jgi:hypothetical protein
MHPMPKNPISKDCKIIRDTLQKSNLIFSKGQIRHLTQKKTNTTQTKRTYKNTQTG